MQLIITIILGFLLQLLSFRYFSYQGIGVNVMLILTIEVALVKGGDRGGLFGFIGGIIEDMFFFGVIGERTIIRLLLGYAAGWIGDKFKAHSFLLQFMLVFISVILQAAFILAVRTLFRYPVISHKNILITAAVNGVVAPLIYTAVKKTNAG